ncbi:vps51/Vps67 domain-containing protein [Hirsutella rhossiliensis]|uniref:Vacuolar protein sorting-associated protein 51 homolog n=1 Tax=Hirsutella rhossiliensis TaxID=111463 RepID=A0A9P8SFS7_9HYPO|nr:vps51/Vps67 domain-containing protein [Hirsutella rhossiliensis]KAH0959735.1 vps51/Vps67 domain-containing protein [Hirsutella rhossiliensis]
MSTIASPRDPPPLRRPSSTPTSPPPSRPSLDLVRSGVASPPPPAAGAAAAGGPPRRSNRAALREYYKLRSPPPPALPRIEVPDSEVPASDLDAPDFDSVAYVEDLVARCSLEDLLRLYARVVGEVRALDAEKKALVYDNYSKLITATETIRKMRANMDPLKPLASTLDPAIAQIYRQASSIRQATRETVPAPDSDEWRAREAQARRRKTRQLAAEALATPQRLRELVRQGKTDEASRQWELPRRLLVSWMDRGVGGDDVQACIDEGDAVFGPTTSEPGSERTSRDANR